MPLDPEKLREAGEKAAGLSKRFDAFLQKRMADTEDDEDDPDDDDLLDPAEEALKETPGSDLDNPNPDKPWFE
jgi:hypothetical protein